MKFYDSPLFSCLLLGEQSNKQRPFSYGFVIAQSPIDYFA